MEGHETGVAWREITATQGEKAKAAGIARHNRKRLSRFTFYQSAVGWPGNQDRAIEPPGLHGGGVDPHPGTPTRCRVRLKFGPGRRWSMATPAAEMADERVSDDVGASANRRPLPRVRLLTLACPLTAAQRSLDDGTRKRPLTTSTKARFRREAVA